MTCHPRRVLCAVAILTLVSAGRMPAQLVVKLSAETVAQFDQYTKNVESELAQRWHDHPSTDNKSFLFIEGDPGLKDRVLGGEIPIRSMSVSSTPAVPLAITNGLIHDWLGAVFIPDTTVDRAVAILKDFDHHADIYPEVTESKLLSHAGATVTGFWRLEQKNGILPIKLDVTQEATYRQISPDRWKGTTYARKIIETDTTPFGRGKQFSLGEGHGYLWRFYAYWSLESTAHGVLAECRTISLSRDIPPGLSWAIAPYVEKQPREALRSTLVNTRKAARPSQVEAARVKAGL